MQQSTFRIVMGAIHRKLELCFWFIDAIKNRGKAPRNRDVDIAIFATKTNFCNTHLQFGSQSGDLQSERQGLIIDYHFI